jgi:hypothetical protein
MPASTRHRFADRVPVDGLDEHQPGCGRDRRSADTAGRPSYDQAQGLRGAPRGSGRLWRTPSRPPCRHPVQPANRDPHRRRPRLPLPAYPWFRARLPPGRPAER